MCTICWQRYGPYFFEEGNGASVTIASDRYVNMLISFIERNLNNHEDFQDELPWFQQDGAIAPTAIKSMKFARKMFSGRIISFRGGDLNWPVRSPDLAPC